MQQQGGVIIYRHLLKQFEKSPQKLKVVFYSPISAKYLGRLKPENFVLSLLPFVELFPDGVTDWNFEDALQIAEKEPCPIFNNAAENLLSGWALANSDAVRQGKVGEAKIKLNEKLLIIDDEYSTWEAAYEQIFANAEENILSPNYQSQDAFREAWRNGSALDEIGQKAKEASFVLSDLYINENHEDAHPFKTRGDLKKISGFQVFEALKKTYPYLPYMMYTTSNKVWNSETFRSEGVWAWAVKDTSPTLGVEDKKAQFEHFQHCFLKTSQDEWKHVSRVWKDLIELKFRDDLESSWWFEKCPMALEILTECLLILDSVYSARSDFESKYIADYQARLCALIFNNLGGICEVLAIKHAEIDGKKDEPATPKTFGAYIYNLRAFFSHQLFYRRAKPIEVIFAVELMINLFRLNKSEFDQQKYWPFKLEREFVANTNLNYLLQLEDLAENHAELQFDKEIFKDLKSSFAGEKTDIISKKTKAQLVKKLVNTFITNQGNSNNA
ncbi:MAG: hypothetical protein H6581_05385 [Bacteroidia bacterium]|nr:hypothetical protein [Bacteroidia bacterium]